MTGDDDDGLTKIIQVMLAKYEPVEIIGRLLIEYEEASGGRPSEILFRSLAALAVNLRLIMLRSGIYGFDARNLFDNLVFRTSQTKATGALADILKDAKETP
jgi:hypothetical protein